MACAAGRNRTTRLPRRIAAAAAPLLPAALLAACDGRQSAFNAGGDEAAALLEITWVLFIGAGVIFAAVMALAAYAVVARPENFFGARSWVIGAGVVFPVVTLTALQVYEYDVARRLRGPAGEDTLRIEVTGVMWWWDVRYPAMDGGEGFRTANELVIPVGRPVELVVTAADVIHSFWVPSLSGKVDMIPGHVNRLRFVVEEAGVYRGQCAEYCGAQHAWMAFDVVAVPPERFAAWLEGQRRPAAEPADPVLAAGRDAFLRSGCGECHVVRGTPADGMRGPDLTHVGGRRSLAAGVLPNGVGALAGWIAGAQHIKPGNRMPSFGNLDGPALRAMAAWLESLE